MAGRCASCSDDAAAEVSQLEALETGAAQVRGQDVLRRPVQNRFGQIVIGHRVVRGHPRQSRHHGAQEKVVQRAERCPGRPGEFAHHQVAPRTQHSIELAKRAVKVFDVAQPETGGDCIEGVVLEGQIHGVGLAEIDLGVTPPPFLQHPFREIHRHHVRSGAHKFDG